MSIRTSYVVQSSASAQSAVTAPLSTIQGSSPPTVSPVAIEADLAVGARVHERRDERAQLQHRAVALDVLAVDGVGDHRLQAGPEHRRLHGHVDELRLAGRQPALVGDQRAERALGGRVVPASGAR